MRNIVTCLLVVMLFSSIVSAGLVEIIINKQPDPVYNLGDSISIPVTLKSTTDVSSSFQMDLMCNGRIINFYKNGVKLLYGEERRLDPSLVLTKETIGELKGDCKIKGIFGVDTILTDEFKVSDLINVRITSEVVEFAPGEDMLIKGEATKETGEEVSGFVQYDVSSGNSSIINELATVNNGFFQINYSLAEDMKAGDYSVALNVYERDFIGETTNVGSSVHNIRVSQVPTNIEMIFENSEVEPGTNLKIKAILHDQTGENIGLNVTLSINNQDGELMEKVDRTTDEFYEFPIAYNEPPAEWEVTAESNGLDAKGVFTISEKEAIEVVLINKTIIIVNIGNVPYNKSILVKVGENGSVNMDVLLDVDETKKYLLSAPDGEYQIEIITSEGNSITGMATLTGRTVDVKEAGGAFIFNPFVWIFIIAILGFVSFIVLKKGYKRSFIGYIKTRSKRRDAGKEIPLSKKSLITSKNKAELSLSMKGDKQNASLVCLKVKNLKEIETKKSNVKELLQKIVDLAEGDKAVVYENQSNLFFMLAPVKTKTFRNEKTAVELAKKIESILMEHNKIAKHKVDFGISLNHGTIVAKQEPDSMKFMSMGTLITTAKKLSSMSNGEVLISEKMKQRLSSDVKTEKHEKGNVKYYTIKEIKSEDHKKFISAFLDRIEHKDPKTGEKKEEKK